MVFPHQDLALLFHLTLEEFVIISISSKLIFVGESEGTIKNAFLKKCMELLKNQFNFLMQPRTLN